MPSESLELTAVLLCVLLAAAVSRRIQGTIVTLPMVYVGLGLLLGHDALGVVEIGAFSEGMRLVAELTLVLVLATDASRIDVRALVHDHTLPLRLLAIGLPLTMVCGTVAAYLLFGELGVWGAAVLAIVLTPTDASLGQSVVSNPVVPQRIRQTLNIESGLNDGIAMPFLLLAISMAEAAEYPGGPGYFLTTATAQIAIGVAAGLAVGVVGVLFLERGHKSGWMSEEFQRISALVLPVLAYSVAEMAGGNGFIAAFCLGLVSGDLARRRGGDLQHSYIETEVQMLMLVVFLLFGAVMLPPALSSAVPEMVVYALLSLTIVRTLPVAVSMVGAGVRRRTTLFVGWFGPRGVASIIYIYSVMDAESIAGLEVIYGAAMITVLISVFAHGVTAAPGSRRYGRVMAGGAEDRAGVAELEEVQELPLRTSPTTSD